MLENHIVLIFAIGCLLILKVMEPFGKLAYKVPRKFETFEDLGTSTLK